MLTKQLKFNEILKTNVVFFKAFFVFIIVLLFIGFFLGNKFIYSSFFMGIWAMLIHLGNIKSFSKKASKQKMIFKIAKPPQTRIFLENFSYKRYLFFSKYKFFVYLLVIFWFWFSSAIKVLDIFGVILGAIAPVFCAFMLGFSMILKNNKKLQKVKN